MPGILCEHCTGVCCRYVALPIDEPESREDFDDIRWYLLHEGMSVFVEDGDWYVNFQTSCRHLQSDSRCGIYQTRPKICRDYTTENCDYHSGDYDWEEHFTCPEHLDEYQKRNLPSRRKKTAKRRGKHLRTRLHPHRPRGPNYAAVSTDMYGVPLPLLGAGR